MKNSDLMAIENAFTISVSLQSIPTNIHWGLGVGGGYVVDLCSTVYLIGIFNFVIWHRNDMQGPIFGFIVKTGTKIEYLHD